MSEKLQQAIDAVQAGDKSKAQGLLSSIIHSNPRNEMAWYWMARAVDDPERKKECLGRVLAINPNNQQAAGELLQLQQPPIETPRPTAQSPVTPAKKKSGISGRGIAWLIIAGLVIFLGVLLCQAGKGSDTPEHSASMAELMCEKFVKKELKSPSTAKFPREERKSAPWQGKPDGYYEVLAAVDSENSFGALVRTRYLCQIHYVGDDRWVLDTLDFLD